MEPLLKTSKAAFLFPLVLMLTVADSWAKMSNFGTNGGNQNYFFYQQSEYPRDCNEVLRGCSSLNSSGVHVIKPDGYPEPYDVYCDFMIGVSSSGWTVVQHRHDGVVEYNRLWEDFKHGFGFTSNEFWIGNEKLSYLTNQGNYELRVDLQLSNGSSFHVMYNGFRISDEWGEYRIVNLGEFHSYGVGLITSCPRNMIYGICTQNGTCEEPSGSSGCPSDRALGTEGCVCAAGYLLNRYGCVPERECPCFWANASSVIPDGQAYVDDDCTKRVSCTDSRLIEEGAYRCGPHAQCAVRDGVRQCHCDEGFRGDGQNCDPHYKDCYDAYVDGHRQDGIYLIKPAGWPGSPFNVSCVMSTRGGGWTVFQRRTGTDRQTNFYRNWTSYRNGFGSFEGDFWLGNENLHYLTNQKSYGLRVDYLTSGNTPRSIGVPSFSVGNEEDNYRLSVSGSTRSEGNGLYYNNARAFSTYDSIMLHHRGVYSHYFPFWMMASMSS